MKKIHYSRLGVSIFLDNSRINSTGKATERGLKNRGFQSSNSSHIELLDAIFMEKTAFERSWPLFELGPILSELT